MAKDTRWDRNLSVAPDADGLIGHAGAVLLRKLADQCGLTPALGAALGRKGKFPLIDRGMALVSMAVAIALGARTMSDIAVLTLLLPKTSSMLVGADVRVGPMLCAIAAGGALVRRGTLWHGDRPCCCDWPISV